MNKILKTFFAASALLASSMANAIMYTETYTYSGAGDYNNDSTLSSGESLNFGFDMENIGGLGSTPASFSLSQDSVGAVTYSAPWDGGTLEIDLYSIDVETEKTTIDVTAYNGALDQILLDTFMWDGTTGNFSISYDFSVSDIAIFDDWGWSNVFIGATSNGPFPTENDFSVSRVSISVVPEPNILFLMGIGLLGFGASRMRYKGS